MFFSYFAALPLEGKVPSPSVPDGDRKVRKDRARPLAYLAAWDVHHANLFDRVSPKTRIEPFGRLVEQVMSSEPYASARTRTDLDAVLAKITEHEPKLTLAAQPAERPDNVY